MVVVSPLRYSFRFVATVQYPLGDCETSSLVSVASVFRNNVEI